MTEPLQSTPTAKTIWPIVAGILGAFSFTVLLLWYNIADGDLWARLAVGASLHHAGHLWVQDVFAFTPTLPSWVDHEWGSGLAFFSMLDWFGPDGLMGLKILLAFCALGFALAPARRAGSAALLLVAIPCAWTLLPGFVPVIRSQVFTYFFFSLTLWISILIGSGRTRLWPLLPLVMLPWANTHGGFVTGFVVMGTFTLMALIQRGPWRPLALGLVTAGMTTLLTPYGSSFYAYLIPALQHPRPRITEWGPMPLWGWDAFTGFRVTFVLAGLILWFGWKRTEPTLRRQSLPGLLLFALTAWIAFQHRRHAPFFGLTAAAVLPPYLRGLLDTLAHRSRLIPAVVLSVYGGILVFTVANLLPGLSTQVLSPVGLFPVRECDILTRAGVSGNLAIPFDWGSYASWRLYPRIKVSMDGRYEETFPESSFEMNERFYNKEGTHWDQLVRDHPVDYVILDRRRTALKPEDLAAIGFLPVWSTPLSELWARSNTVETLRNAVSTLPDTTIEPLDSRIPAGWPWPSRQSRR